jgi:hypothetical protein
MTSLLPYRGISACSSESQNEEPSLIFVSQVFAEVGAIRVLQNAATRQAIRSKILKMTNFICKC